MMGTGRWLVLCSCVYVCLQVLLRVSVRVCVCVTVCLQVLLRVSVHVAISMYSVIAIAAGIMSFLLPIETKGREMTVSLVMSRRDLSFTYMHSISILPIFGAVRG